LIKAAPDQESAELLTAGFLTGARYGELIACSFCDFDATSMVLKVDGKTGPRTIVLQSEAVTFFKRISKGQAPDEPLLRRGAVASIAATASHDPGIRTSISPQRRNILRPSPLLHFPSYRRRSSLDIIPENCGTSVRVMEITYAKVLATKRRDLIERGAPTLGS
jgi:hypothetical protein